MPLSHLAWERFRVSQEERESVAGEKDVWGALLSLLPPRISGRKWMDGWMNGFIGPFVMHWVIMTSCDHHVSIGSHAHYSWVPCGQRLLVCVQTIGSCLHLSSLLSSAPSGMFSWGPLPAAEPVPQRVLPLRRAADVLPAGAGLRPCPGTRLVPVQHIRQACQHAHPVCGGRTLTLVCCRTRR